MKAGEDAADEVERRRRLARSWPRAAALAAGAVYVPQLLPLVATDLASHGHCLAIYARTFPVLVGLAPGISARIASGLGDPWQDVVLFAVAGLATLALLALTATALRQRRRAGIAAAVAVALLSALLSMGAAAAIRA